MGREGAVVAAALVLVSWAAPAPAVAAPATAAAANFPASGGASAGEPVTEPYSEPLRNAGIALTVIGPLLAGLGAALLLTHMEVGGTSAADRPIMVTGLVMMPVGATLLLGGIPLWIVGAWEVPVTDGNAARAPTRHAVMGVRQFVIGGRF